MTIGVGIGIGIAIVSVLFDTDSDGSWFKALFGPASAGIVFELYVPIEIITPGLWSNSETNRDMQHGRNPLGLFGAANQGHAGLLRSASALLVIAF